VTREPDLSDAGVASTTLRFIDDHRGQLLLHSGALASPRGEVIVVHGESGSGKTTLTAALAATGLAYLTDETVCLDPQTLQVEPFRKPLTVKPGSQQVLEQLRPPADRIDPTSGNWQVDPAALEALGAVDPPAAPLFPTLIVFPDHDPEQQGVELQPVSRARAAFVLGEQSSALWAVQPRPLAALQRLVDTAPAYRATYASAFDAASVITGELLGGPTSASRPAADEPGETDPGSSDPAPSGNPAPRQGVDWLALDGEAVLFDGTHLHHLDTPGAAVWQLLDGTRDESEVARELADRFDADPATVLLDVEDLVRVLRARGLLT
jgi:hypothetical protein